MGDLDGRIRPDSMFSLMNFSSSICSVALIGYTLPLSFRSCSLPGRRWISWSHGLRSGSVSNFFFEKTSAYSLYASGIVTSLYRPVLLWRFRCQLCPCGVDVLICESVVFGCDDSYCELP